MKWRILHVSAVGSYPETLEDFDIGGRATLELHFKSRDESCDFLLPPVKLTRVHYRDQKWALDIVFLCKECHEGYGEKRVFPPTLLRYDSFAVVLVSTYHQAQTLKISFK
jgi:hypothetical protein